MPSLLTICLTMWQASACKVDTVMENLTGYKRNRREEADQHPSLDIRGGGKSNCSARMSSTIYSLTSQKAIPFS